MYILNLSAIHSIVVIGTTGGENAESQKPFKTDLGSPCTEMQSDENASADADVHVEVTSCCHKSGPCKTQLPITG